VGSAAGLELRQEVTDVRLHRLLREEEPLADLAVHEAVRDQLEHLDLAHGRLLLELAQGRLERDHLGALTAAVAAGGHLVEATGVVQVSAQDVLALCGVHGAVIGSRPCGQHPKKREQAGWCLLRDTAETAGHEPGRKRHRDRRDRKEPERRDAWHEDREYEQGHVEAQAWLGQRDDRAHV
jgi:hypothetical protein